MAGTFSSRSMHHRPTVEVMIFDNPEFEHERSGTHVASIGKSARSRGLALAHVN